MLVAMDITLLDVSDYAFVLLFVTETEDERSLCLTSVNLMLRTHLWANQPGASRHYEGMADFVVPVLPDHKRTALKPVRLTRLLR